MSAKILAVYIGNKKMINTLWVFVGVLIGYFVGYGKGWMDRDLNPFKFKEKK